MQVGPEYWHCVTTDSAGVPHGGRYGNVQWFEEHANRAGLKVAWSRRYNCFAIYTVNPGGKHVFQIMLRKWGRRGWGDIVPMNHLLLVGLTRIREEDCRHGGNIMQCMALHQKQRKDALIAEWEQADEDIRPEILRKVDLRLGAVTPNVMVLPKRIQIYDPRAQRRRMAKHLRKQRAGRILVP